MTANMREWRHVFKLRLAPAAHPKMRDLMGMAMTQFCLAGLSVLFEDIV
jgi:thymidylate synthase (FAD)